MDNVNFCIEKFPIDGMLRRRMQMHPNWSELRYLAFRIPSQQLRRFRPGRASEVHVPVGLHPLSLFQRLFKRPSKAIQLNGNIGI